MAFNLGDYIKFLLVFLLSSNESIAVDSKKLDDVYDKKIIPYYDSYRLKKFPYHNDLKKYFVFKFISKKSEKLLVILPGKGEQIERYAEMIYDLKSMDIDILLIQFRGQGLSSRSLNDKEKTHIEDFDYVVEDIYGLFQNYHLKNSYKKINLFAHSMGAHHGLRLQAKYQFFNEIVLNSPLIGLFSAEKTFKNYYLSKLLDFIGFKNFYVPGGGGWQDRKYETNSISNSKERYEKIRRIDFKNPDNRMGAVTIRWAHEAFESEKILFENIDKFRIPLALFQAGEENVISNEKQNKFCQQVKSCQIFHIEGAKHNILQEIDEYRTPLINYIKATL